MKSNFKTFSLAALLILASVSAEAVVAPHSKTIVVESPENLPILAQSDAEAMYLHDTNDGRTLLYVETKNGQELTALDVTDPSRIQRIAQTELPATSAYDFVRNVGDTSVVIRYRNGSGAALISFRHTKRPQLTTSIALSGAETFQRWVLLRSWLALVSLPRSRVAPQATKWSIRPTPCPPLFLPISRRCSRWSPSLTQVRSSS
jgi:hypothetical protein